MRAVSGSKSTSGTSHLQDPRMRGPEPDRTRSCTRKKAYESLKQAEKVARLAMQRKEGLDLHGYACTYCGQFHIGRRIKQ